MNLYFVRFIHRTPNKEELIENGIAINNHGFVQNDRFSYTNNGEVKVNGLPVYFCKTKEEAPKLASAKDTPYRRNGDIVVIAEMDEDLFKTEQAVLGKNIPFIDERFDSNTKRADSYFHQTDMQYLDFNVPPDKLEELSPGLRIPFDSLTGDLVDYYRKEFYFAKVPNSGSYKIVIYQIIEERLVEKDINSFPSNIEGNSINKLRL